jgi:hypothetical protein
VDREGTIFGSAGTYVFCGVSLVRSPLYTNDRKTAACGSRKTPSILPAGYRQRRWKKTKKRKKGVMAENSEEEQKKMISTGSNRPSGYSFGTALTEAQFLEAKKEICYV